MMFMGLSWDISCYFWVLILNLKPYKICLSKKERSGYLFQYCLKNKNALMSFMFYLWEVPLCLKSNSVKNGL